MSDREHILRPLEQAVETIEGEAPRPSKAARNEFDFYSVMTVVSSFASGGLFIEAIDAAFNHNVNWALLLLGGSALGLILAGISLQQVVKVVVRNS